MVLLESGVLRTELPSSKQESKPLWQLPSAVGGSSPLLQGSTLFTIPTALLRACLELPHWYSTASNPS